MNAFKKSACVTKRGISPAKLLEAIAKIPSDMKTSEDPSDPLLQVLLFLFTKTIKYSFYRLDGKIGELSYQKKRTVVEDIVQKWGQSILGSGGCVL